MKCFMADTAVKEAAKSDAVEPCLRFFRTALIQLHAVGIAVISLSQLAQSLTVFKNIIDQRLRICVWCNRIDLKITLCASTFSDLQKA